MKVLLAMSGGVDSSVCGYLLKKQGYDVGGVTFDLGITSRERFARDAEDARTVAEQLGISHEVVEFKDYFHDNVVNDFVDAYKKGLTPNPCVICNRVLKFGALLDYAIERGYDRLATGHYASIVNVGGVNRLAKAKDVYKDQTYFLYGIGNWDRVIFPLGKLTKEEVRAIAEEIGIKTKTKKDSQEICFIDTDYRDFLEGLGVELPKPGEFVDSEGNVIGTHDGIHNYTIGQRKGLNIALGHRAYVTKVDSATGRVTLGLESGLMKNVVRAKLPDTLSAPMLEDKEYEVKVRYKLHGDRAFVKCEDGILIARFCDAVRGPTPGQSMVVYDGDIVVTGGEIFDAYSE